MNTFRLFKFITKHSETEKEKALKKSNLVIWLVAGLMTCIAIGCQLGYQAGYHNGVNRAIACTSQDGVLLHDGHQYFCMFE